jgi:hypothetical protein
VSLNFYDLLDHQVEALLGSNRSYNPLSRSQPHRGEREDTVLYDQPPD